MKSKTYAVQDGVQQGAQPCTTLHSSQKRERVIRCTPENAPQMQQVVKNWPELHALVKDLQAANLFPGLRGLQITLSGPPEYVGKGLAALLPENPVNRE